MLATVGGLEPRTRLVYTVVAWISFLTIVAVFVYGVYESYMSPGQPVGRVLVDVYWPFRPYFAQPVTYFSVACVALFYSGLRLWERRISHWPPSLLSLLQVLGFIVAFSSAYEVIYNFIFWGGDLHCGSAPERHVDPRPPEQQLSCSVELRFCHQGVLGLICDIRVLSLFSEAAPVQNHLAVFEGAPHPE